MKQTPDENEQGCAASNTAAWFAEEHDTKHHADEHAGLPHRDCTTHYIGFYFATSA